MAQIPDEVTRAIYRLKERLLPGLAIKRIFLFGSYARGNFSEYSDIDICLIVDGIQDNFSLMLDIAPVAVHIDPRIETVVFSAQEYAEESSVGLLGEIKRWGIEI
jgi:predicted nucleotidyltransferase